MKSCKNPDIAHTPRTDPNGMVTNRTLPHTSTHQSPHIPNSLPKEPGNLKHEPTG